MGLSPRVRGNRGLRSWRVLGKGSIPACAGEPSTTLRTIFRKKVYPRVCGGTQFMPNYVLHDEGLSPRVRGNLPGTSLSEGRSGSIPACAGEPDRRRLRQPAVEVYPRVCGGTAWCPACCQVSRGLSPRVRGNPRRLRQFARRPRSIPACAGEPTSPPSRPPAGAVYPRVCGGTMPKTPAPCAWCGLSPRVRGNPHPNRP